MIRGRQFVVAVAIVSSAAFGARIAAHDLERTEVALAFAADGTFTLDVSNDPNWLLLRLESFAGGRVPAGVTPQARDARLAELSSVFVDRVVLFVDGHEIRPSSAQYVPSRAAFRLEGRLPPDARALRWLYGLVIDPYRLTLRRADGRVITEWIEGSNWSGTLDVSRQQSSRRLLDPILFVALVFVLSLALRLRSLRR